MKAYNVYSNYIDEYTVIIFAESAGKAKSFALNHTDEFNRWDGNEFTDLRARRRKEVDDCYRGHQYMDFWENDQDRYDLATKLGWHCDEEYIDEDECKECVARDVCVGYKDYLKEKELYEKEICDETLA